MTGCVRSDSRQCCGRPADRENNLKTFDDIIRDYREHYDEDNKDEEKWFGAKGCSLRDAISRAVACKLRNGNHHSHQWCVPSDTYKHAERALLEIAPQIASAKTFDDIFDLVSIALGDVGGAGELFRYDVADRIGCHLNIRPEKVYLHAGVRIGAKNLEIDVRGRISLDRSELNGRFGDLAAFEIENVLCIYKDQMQKLAADFHSSL